MKNVHLVHLYATHAVTQRLTAQNADMKWSHDKSTGFDASNAPEKSKEVEKETEKLGYLVSFKDLPAFDEDELKVLIVPSPHIRPSTQYIRYINITKVFIGDEASDIKSIKLDFDQSGRFTGSAAVVFHQEATGKAVSKRINGK